MWLLVAGALAAPAFSQTSPRVQVLVTAYATPLESDFGAQATEEVAWRLKGAFRIHRSLFAPGFASRETEDPKHPGIMGVGMEGAGWISPRLHGGDRDLAAALAAGYRVLTLDRWDERSRTGTFILTRDPLGGDDDLPLVEGVSAAVRAGNALFPTKRWVRLSLNGNPAGYRRIHDECSSCGIDAHIDLYQPVDSPIAEDGRWEAELMPPGFLPPP
jgi:hypothetical protein